MKRIPEYIVVIGCLWILSIPTTGWGQGPVATTTYYLHKETVAPWTTIPTLRLANPDQGFSTAQSPNYRNVAAPFLDPVFKTFRSVAPSTPGTILAGSTVTFTIWMKKSTGFGTVYPYVKLWTYDNDDVLGGNLIPVCAATGNTALGTSVTKYILSCTASAASPMTTTRAYRMDVGAYVLASPMQHNLTVSVYFDGIIFSGSYPSSIMIPNSIPPAIGGLSSSSGMIGSRVTIQGAYFGNTQGSSVVTFNGVSAPVHNWSNTSIEVSVPVTDSGPVVVSVNGASSNAASFLVIRPTISSIYPNRGAVGSPVTLTGSNFGEFFDPSSTTLLFNGVETTPTSWSDTTIEALVPSTTTGPVMVRVNGTDSNSVNFTVTFPAISAITPATAYLGSMVTISGSGFGDSYLPGATRITFNNVAVTPMKWSDTSIRAVVPPTTTGPVVVQTFDAVSNSVLLTILPNLTTTRNRDYIYLGDRPLTIESGGGSNGGSEQYRFVRPLTINHTLVPATQSNFPVLVAKTHPHLKSVSNGGWVERQAGGKPADVAFFANRDLTTPLDFEIERYDPGSGELLAWVRIPSLSSTADTVFYVAYGNAAISASPEQPAAVWDSHFKFVGHLPNGSVLSAADSSSFGNSGTPVNDPAATTGHVDGAVNLNAAEAQHIRLPASFNHGSAAMTWSAWVRATSLPNAYNAVLAGAASGNSQYTRILVRSDGKLSLSARSEFPAIYGDLSYDGGAHAINPGSWYYLAMTAAYTGGNPASRMTGYVNGVLDGANGVLMSISPLTQPVMIGRDPITMPRDWNGAIDEVRISNVERSASWILTEYNTQANPDAFVVMGDPISN